MDGVQSIPVLTDSENFRKDTVSNRHHNSWLLRIKLPYVVEGRASNGNILLRFEFTPTAVQCNGNY